MSRNDWEAENYFSKDFEWDQLKEEVQNDPSLQFHLLSCNSQNIVIQNQDSQAWERFHSRHSTGKFFKLTGALPCSGIFEGEFCLSHSFPEFLGKFHERRYLLKEFPELGSCKDDSKVLEVGCGNGSTVLPILRGRKSIIIYACDCSNEALERAKEIISTANSISCKHRFQPFLCDFSTLGFPSWLACNTCSGSFLQMHNLGFSGPNCSNEINDLNPASSNENKCCVGGVDFVTLIFTLSALPVDRMPKAIAHCLSVLKPGGLVLFRDYGNSSIEGIVGNSVSFISMGFYLFGCCMNLMKQLLVMRSGLYDMTMLRFKPEQRVGYREYLRSDGTRSYFFCLDAVRNLTSAAGFIELELEYCCVKSVNRRNGKVMKRVWVHGKFQKPTCSSEFHS